MLLQTYLEMTRKTDAAFAEEIGISRPMVSKLRKRQVLPSFDTALAIEMATKGEVRLADMQLAVPRASVPREAAE